jgi:hypothetical protein
MKVFVWAGNEEPILCGWDRERRQIAPSFQKTLPKATRRLNSYVLPEMNAYMSLGVQVDQEHLPVMLGRKEPGEMNGDCRFPDPTLLGRDRQNRRLQVSRFHPVVSSQCNHVLPPLRSRLL